MRKLALFIAAIGALAAPVAASAHPLGNFTINHSSTVVLSGDRAYVHYVLDMAEIPTLQAGQQGSLDARVLSRKIVPALSLSIDGHRAALRPVRERLQLLPGAAGLKTTRLELVLAGPRLDGATGVRYGDGSFAGRLGWKEVVVTASRGAAIIRTSAPAASPSDELRAYPKDRLSSPVDVTTASAAVRPGSAAGVPPALSTPRQASHASGFTSLVERRDLGAWGIFAALAIALFWGAAHALGPGHGKSIVAAYLVGQRGQVRHAIGLGGIVTVTHTAGVFALGAVTLALSEVIVPEDLYPWLNLVAGVMVVTIGFGVLRARIAHRRAHARGHGHEHHDHHHHHEHDLSPRALLAVGVSGGLLPCPSALVVLLAAISLHRVAFGMALVLAFSVGLALTISAIGLVAVLANGIFKRASFEGRLVRALPAVSALAILATGIVMTLRALPTVSL
jgi:ABC-type nickel/cobalt efflux system permease component RcnA